MSMKNTDILVKDTQAADAQESPDTVKQGGAVKTEQRDDASQQEEHDKNGIIARFTGFTKRARRASIEATPAFIVNNSSNILGASHVATEMLMFKSGLKDSKLIDNPENPINWVVQPFNKIRKDIFKNAKTRDFSIGDIFRGNPVKNAKNLFFDTHAASLRELETQTAANRELIAAGKAAEKISLGNPWQSRTTGTGLLIWTISALMPERKESDEEIERMAKMRTLNPLGYIGERFKQAVWIPQWPQHKREMLGLGYLFIGLFSGLGSWRNRKELKPFIEKDMELISKGLTQGYTFNPGYFFTSVVSFVAGLPLLFALDERKAYSTYGSLSVFRIPGLVDSVRSKMMKKEPGWQYYTAGKLTFQAEDMAFSLIGGATKHVKPDGTVEIIDHDELKKKAIAEAKEEKMESKDKDEERCSKTPYKPHVSTGGMVDGQYNGRTKINDTPSTLVSGSTTVQHAMPERVAAMQQETV